MRANLPVTNIEHFLDENSALVSTTDLESRITYANPAFIEISGYSEEELLGELHNLVRHPDMPPEAFADMWRTIEAGQSWTAPVKNRCKNGDFYWVKANITPIIERGKPVGYMSVRTKPSREEIVAASALYAEMRAGRSRYAIRNGSVVRTGLLGRLMAWSRLSTRARIWLAMGILSLATVGVSLVEQLWLTADASAATAQEWPMLLLLGFSCLILPGALGLWLSGAIARPLGDLLQLARRIASGDLGSRLSTTRSDEMGQIMQGLNQTNVNLMGIVADVHAQTRNIHHEIDEIASGISDLSSRTESQAASLEETAASMEQIYTTVQHTADLAQQAHRLTQSTTAIAERSSQVVSQLADNMTDINGSSTRIADIIGVIDEIAFQTNILALNAAVEAARAGEQGRGFAVVAAEVRNLAQKTATAAKEIKGLIGDSLSNVESGTRLSGEASKAMGEVVAAVGQVSEMMNGISHATREQAVGIDQINDAATQLDRVTQENAAFAERITFAASALSDHANRLLGAVNVFKVGSPSKTLDSRRNKTAASAPSHSVVNPDLVPEAQRRTFADYPGKRRFVASGQ